MTAESTLAVVENIIGFLSLDASNEDEYEESMDRLIALEMMFEDILRQVGITKDPLTDIAEVARTNSPYYRPVSILPKDGRKP